MYRTTALHRMVSTSHGQRRILKKSPPIAKYIRQAVESGTYYDASTEKQQAFQRRKAPYGTNFRDLPVEYEILTLYPPIPTPPRIPKKERGLRVHDSHVPTEKLVKEFLQRQEFQQHKSMSVEEYYDKLLGIPSPSSQTAMGKKSAVLNKAYAFALRQYQVLRENDDLTEDESIDIVDKLLKEEKKTEQYNSRKTSATLQEWRTTKSNKEEETNKPTSATSSDATTTTATSDSEPLYQQEDGSSYPSILYKKPRAIQGMTMWSQRLKAVPYREWTIGASTALDHWIARSILGLEEDTWQQLLEGDSHSTPSLWSQGNDIIAVRQSLFPETVLDGSLREQEQYHDVMEEDEQQDTTTSSFSDQDKTIDELLLSLGGFDGDDFDTADNDSTTGSLWPSSSISDDGDDGDLDSKVQKLVTNLQEWRQRNVDSPYEEWSTNTKDEFASWLDMYVATLSSNREGEVDLVATRKALLESPPVEKEESDKFWQQVRDETEAEILLQSLKKTGTVPSPKDAATAGERKAREAFALFQHLPYDVQLQKLVDLGTLRPLLDEYTLESDRIKFLARYGEKLMEGVEMEHLVPDAEGPIRGDELGRWGEENGIGAEERFRMKMVPYGSNEFGGTKSDRAREMYQAWNTHKAGRARFEEIMFKKNRLGLRYNLDAKGKVRTS